MKIQILWVPPAERRFGSGDIMTAAQLAELGVDAKELLAAGDAQVLSDPKIERAVQPHAAKETRKKKG